MRVAIVTVSDGVSRGLREDLSGATIREMVEAAGGTVVAHRVVPDERPQIAEVLRHLADSGQVDVILTTGGTGLAPRDVTPEATRDVLDKEAPGLAEAMRLEGLRHTPRAMLSRATAGVRGRTLIVNLPGSPKGVRESLGVVLPQLPHAVALLRDEPSGH